MPAQSAGSFQAALAELDGDASVVRLSITIAPWVEALRVAEEKWQLRRDYEQKVHAGEYPAHETLVPLYPYQREGMLHLAFTGPAMLADEMASARRSRRSPRARCSTGSARRNACSSSRPLPSRRNGRNRSRASRHFRSRSYSETNYNAFARTSTRRFSLSSITSRCSQRRDPPVQGRSELPRFPQHRFRRRRAQPPKCERRHQLRISTPPANLAAALAPPLSYRWGGDAMRLQPLVTGGDLALAPLIDATRRALEIANA